MLWLITPYHQDCLHYDILALHYYAIWFQCSFHLCYMYRVIIGGNLVRLSKESGMQKNKADFFRLPSAIPDTIFLSVKNTGLKKLIKVIVIFIIYLKLIIVDIKYH